ncbi:hypothetical protein QBC35DRAFT_473148 [Podospora australis]|uniref:Secreted protein n=1 Tax=Podospora australis TaxID=1536484 RepID=A0AAN7AHJ7_9PEZI|nr:hypothetical protein QBC35DRAFT_473148 [Podospora australis]
MDVTCLLVLIYVGACVALDEKQSGKMSFREAYPMMGTANQTAERFLLPDPNSTSRGRSGKSVPPSECGNPSKARPITTLCVVIGKHSMMFGGTRGKCKREEGQIEGGYLICGPDLFGE